MTGKVSGITREITQRITQGRMRERMRGPMQTNKAKKILPGSIFSVVAPSSHIRKQLLLDGEKKIERLGYSLDYTKKIFSEEKFWAGADSLRIHEFLAAIENPETRAIWCARGGYGATRLFLDFDRLHIGQKFRNAHKLLLGYSDITALHLYFWQKAQMPALHAPLMATPSWLNMRSPAIKNMFSLFQGTAGIEKKSYTARWNTKFIGPSPEKAVEGIILGGNLSVITAMAGTPWQPSFTGTLLFLEDCNEAPYRIDRMLTQITQAGMLSGIRGVLLGDMSHDVPKELLRKVHWKAVVKDHFVAKGIPVLENLPVGHGKINEALPLGIRARITVRGKLELLEQVVG